VTSVSHRFPVKDARGFVIVQRHRLLVEPHKIRILNAWFAPISAELVAAESELFKLKGSSFVDPLQTEVVEEETFVPRMLGDHCKSGVGGLEIVTNWPIKSVLPVDGRLILQGVVGVGQFAPEHLSNSDTSAMVAHYKQDILSECR